MASKLAQKINGIVINADSKQIYREIPVITAQPADNIVPHWLYGHISVKDEYSVAHWLKDVTRAINAAWDKKMTPILTGGTGFYLKALTNGLNSLPKISESTKQKVQHMLKTEKREQLHDFLVSKDPEAASKIYPGDSYRLGRALEIIMQSNKTPTEWKKARPEMPIPNATFKKYVVNFAREKIYGKINLRFINMMKQGALEEAETLLSMNLPQNSPAMKSHGIPELIQYLQGKISLSQATTKAQQNTRNYAKRQLTWLRKQMPDAQPVASIKDICDI
ncbi:tRNA dimethylallyltransferase [Rickettsiales bacterium]|nr:tRNA dimethylallyltransferase [Rickettsiales bacterium]